MSVGSRGVTSGVAERDEIVSLNDGWGWKEFCDIVGLVGDGILYVRLPDVMFKPRIPCAISSSLPKKEGLRKEIFITSLTLI